MKHLFLAFLALSTGCIEEKNYCDEYVDYMCDCHEDDPDYDCAAQQAIYADADFEQQQECSISLDEQIQQDQDDGLDCQLGNDTGNSSDTGDTGLSYFFD